MLVCPFLELFVSPSINVVSLILEFFYVYDKPDIKVLIDPETLLSPDIDAMK